jgi:hypothetical protein
LPEPSGKIDISKAEKNGREIMTHKIATVRCRRCVAVAWSWARERRCSSRKLLIAGCARLREGRGRTIGPS